MNNLTEAQIERLALLSEELGEVQHMIGKILRHGYDSSHPDYGNITNRDLLRKEILDLHVVLELTSENEDVDLEFTLEEWNNVVRKKNSLLHHNEIKYETD